MSDLPALPVVEEEDYDSPPPQPRVFPLKPLVLTRQPIPIGIEYMMGGVPVHFPLKGYKSQVAIMSKVITTAQKQQNCLLESPTGSGKTLALLCGALAWQAKEIAAIRQMRDDIQMNMQDESMLSEHGDSFDQVKEEPQKCNFCTNAATKCVAQTSAQPAAQTAAQPEAVIDLISDDGDEGYSDDDDFKPAKKKQKGVSFLSDSKPAVKSKVIPVVNPGSCSCKNSVNNTYDRAKADDTWEEVENDFPEVPKIPRIFYGTRTHKQIQQVVKELKSTQYRSVKMTVLASREHMCIHSRGSYRSATEMCHELLDPRTGPGCCFKNNVDKFGTHALLSQAGCPEPFDIEDLVKVGNQAKACPYFISRSLMQKGAEVIFCPYNYLIDPHIRDAMQLNLSGSIIILDEGHNIEDVAKESASYSVTKEELKNSAEDCKITAINGRLREDHNVLERYLNEVVAWIDTQDDDLKSTGDFNSMSKTFGGLEAIASFENFKIGRMPFQSFKACVDNVISDMTKQEPPMPPPLPMIHSTTRLMLNGLVAVFENLYFNDMARAVDYHVNISKVLQNSPFRNKAYGSWHRQNADDQQETGWAFTLHFWCMNPAVAMESLSKIARSVILTSGTLSPMDSFSSELGMDFSMKFEADHVIESNQVFVRSISHGPRGLSLNGQFKNTQTFEYQDELGRLVLNVCQTVKYGVLCFFPSYKLLETCTRRWEQTGLQDELLKHKMVLSEPRKASDLDEVMSEFRESINNPAYLGKSFCMETVEGTLSARSGSLLFAVYRGKISEGIDFADNHARAVIAIGIPYPAFKDVKVEMKRAYNDLHSKSRGLLTGSRWYEIQAYRALNQALGRCIRNRNDWGAILLVDDRYCKGNYYTNGLSKWIRKELRHYTRYNDLMTDLQSFIQERTLLTNIDAEELQGAS